jgi:hypothetical protein
MKNMILCLCVILPVSCGEAGTALRQVPAIDMQTLETIDFDRMVEEVECVLLENSPAGSMLGCWKIIEYDTLFYIYSLDDFGVYLFGRSGAFLQAIDGSSKRGKIRMPSDIFINEEKRQLWILESRHSIARYTLEGAFVEQQELPFPAVKMAGAGTEEYLFYDGGFDRENPWFLRKTSGSDFQESSLFVRKYIRNYTHIPMSLFAAGHHCIYACLPYNDTLYIYSETEKEVYPACRLDFHGEFLTHGEMPSEGYSMEAYDKLLHENRKITDIRGFHCVNGFLFMKLTGRDHSFRMIDVANRQAYRFESLIDGIQGVPQGSTENSLVICLPGSEFVRHYSGGRKTGYPAIKTLLKQLETRNGRVICKIKLKEKMP